MTSLPCVYHDDYDTPLPQGHRFPMQKFRMLRELLERDGVVSRSNFVQPETPAIELLEAVHAPDYVQAFLAGELTRDAERRIGLPWSPGLARRSRIAVGGTLRTAKLALEHGLACNTAGGTHHAFREFGSGFCIFNDLAVTARTLLDRGVVQSVLIVDLDVHQGDGTAAIFAAESRVFTFSMHCRENFPMRKQTSDRDVELPEGSGDDFYLGRLAEELPPLLDQLAPDIALYDAGADPHADDLLGKLALSDAGLVRRDRFVLEECRRRGLPVACVIGGGYGKDLDALVQRHSLLHRTAREFV